MKLYFTPAACSQAAHIIARELGLPLELIRVDLARHVLADGGADYLSLNPKGYVPMLVLDDGAVLTESSVILQYLADLRPGRVAPVWGTWERWRLMEMLAFISTEIHKGSALLWIPDTASQVRDVVTRKVGTHLAYLGKAVADQPFLLGGLFTVADAYLFVLLNWMLIKQFDLAPWPNLLAYHHRIAGRPSVEAALEAEGLKK